MKVYPNLETLYLYNRSHYETISDHHECLSSIKFPNLTSLSLKRFSFHDGAFLVTVLKLKFFFKVSYLNGQFRFKILDDKTMPKIAMPEYVRDFFCGTDVCFKSKLISSTRYSPPGCQVRTATKLERMKFSRYK